MKSLTHGQKIVLAGIHLWQGTHQGAPSPCRFIPSCSVYAEEAVTEHGVVRGLGYAARRLSRCHPFGGHGVDLVPPHRAER